MSADPVPPQNLEAEQSVLGSMLVNSWAAARLAQHLCPEDFYREAHQRVFAAFLAVIESGAPPDLVTVTAEIRRKGVEEAIGGVAYLTRLMDTVPTAANADYYARLVRECARKRMGIRSAESLLNNLHNGRTYADSMAEFQDRVYHASLSQDEQGPAVTLEDLFVQAMGRETATMGRGVTTGFPLLDRMTNGLEPGELWIVAARPSIGKTAFSLSVAQHVARKHRTLFVSLEQTAEAIHWRLLGMVSGIPTRTLRFEALQSRQRERLTVAYEKISEWKLAVEAPAMTTLGQLRRLLQSHRDTVGLEFAVVDYASLIHTPGNDSLYEKTTKISQGVKLMAKELDVPIMLLSQLSRANEKREDKRPMLSDLRDSGAIEQDADVVLGLYRPAYYEQDKPPSSEPQEAEVLVLKEREGETGTAKVLFLPERTFFYAGDF